jgi:hypothetical protein
MWAVHSCHSSFAPPTSAKLEILEQKGNKSSKNEASVGAFRISAREFNG